MKRILFFALIFIFSYPSFAQADSANPFLLQVCCNKTTSVVFPQMIKSIDRGSRDLLVQKAAGVENILQMKAAKENFAETNMTVITTDGKLWSFDVRYAASPTVLALSLDSAKNVFETIAARQKTIHGVKDESYEMIVRLKGIYIQNNIIYYQLELENKSNISYDIDLLRFYTKDKKQSKRTASQELEQLPLSIYGNAATVAAQSKHIIVVALPKCTIVGKKHFYIDVMERNGGRNLRLKVTNRKIIQARLV